MTDLERELLSAFERLENDYNARQAEWANAFEALQSMFEVTQRDNVKLARQVAGLSQQVERLSERMSSWQPVKRRQ